MKKGLQLEETDKVYWNVGKGVGTGKALHEGRCFFRNYIRINMKKYGYILPTVLCGIIILVVSQKYALDFICWQVYPHMWIVALFG